jgi:hypothetical protein
MDDARKATSDEWVRYYAETAPRGRHGKNDPIELQRLRALFRERVGILAALGALAATLVGYVVFLGS